MRVLKCKLFNGDPVIIVPYTAAMWSWLSIVIRQREQNPIRDKNHDVPVL